MRIVATSDTHKPFDADMIPDGDVFIHGGDLMYTGYPDEWNGVLESLRALPHKRKILIPGNHDFHIQNYEGVARAELRRAGVELVGTSRPVVEVGGLKLLGLPYVTGIPGWAYNVEDEWYYAHLNECTAREGPFDIVVSHAPMYAVLDAIHPEAKEWRDQIHVGTHAANRWFNKLEQKPRVWINGHIHESYGRELGTETAFFNVAMCDRDYEQTNKPMVIDL